MRTNLNLKLLFLLCPKNIKVTVKKRTVKRNKGKKSLTDKGKDKDGKKNEAIELKYITRPSLLACLT